MKPAFLATLILMSTSAFASASSYTCVNKSDSSDVVEFTFGGGAQGADLLVDHKLGDSALNVIGMAPVMVTPSSFSPSCPIKLERLSS